MQRVSVFGDLPALVQENHLEFIEKVVPKVKVSIGQGCLKGQYYTGQVCLNSQG